ncbi:MAG: type 1 glutamine amidotransferase [Thermoleophilia bacterium]
MEPTMNMRVAHLYPGMMNIYADRGNIIALERHCAWRGIGFSVTGFSLDEPIDWGGYDFFYLGGGQDRDQRLVSEDLRRRGSGLIEAVEGGAVVLAVCGGYQLLGDYYITGVGERMEGVGLFGAHTVAGTRRCIGNVVVEAGIGGRTLTLAGFENHAGKTYLDAGQQPLGTVVSGFGNNAEDGTEGIIYRNAIGTYLHGPLLPKNTALAEYLVLQALRHRHGEDVGPLSPIDYAFEDEAREVAVRLAGGG